MLTLIMIFLDTACSLLAKKTEGFSPKDLQSLLGRAFHRAAVRKIKKLTGNECLKCKSLQNITAVYQVLV